MEKVNSEALQQIRQLCNTANLRNVKQIQDVLDVNRVIASMMDRFGIDVPYSTADKILQTDNHTADIWGVPLRTYHGIELLYCNTVTANDIDMFSHIFNIKDVKALQTHSSYIAVRYSCNAVILRDRRHYLDGVAQWLSDTLDQYNADIVSKYQMESNDFENGDILRNDGSWFPEDKCNNFLFAASDKAKKLVADFDNIVTLAEKIKQQQIKQQRVYRLQDKIAQIQKNQ